ncbi:MAG: helix-turn-helix transcriptional regulator [Treponema sp.]|nr:helix-turn-helix transcriptional regulator [Treponema sp.]
MATRAYQKFYLDDAQQNLAVMFDYAIRLLKYDGDQFFLYFIQSEVAQKFEHANPKYIAGMCGIELCQNVLNKIGESPKYPDEPEIKMGKEFWLGWVLAYYQWYSGLKFSDLQEYGLVPSEILSRYILHEADISKFVSVANKIILANKAASPTRLQKIRKARGFTQKELSELSGVSLRMIQLYEQRQNDINQASGQTINNLARALCCSFYEIMEIELEEEK